MNARAAHGSTASRGPRVGRAAPPTSRAKSSGNWSICLRNTSTNMSSASLASIASLPGLPSSVSSAATRIRLEIQPRLTSDIGACMIRGNASSTGLKGRASQPRNPQTILQFELAVSCHLHHQRQRTVRRATIDGEIRLIRAHSASGGGDAHLPARENDDVARQKPDMEIGLRQRDPARALEHDVKEDDVFGFRHHPSRNQVRRRQLPDPRLR